MEVTDIIFDTDAGSDCDDMMALAYLIYARRHLGANILAVTHCLNGNYGISAIRAFFRCYGERLPNIGKVTNGVTLPDRYCGAISREFGISEDNAEAENAVTVLRRALAECKNKCVICAVGHFTNIAALINSGSDEISPLSGMELLREKCSKLVVMAAKFREDENGIRSADWNILNDVRSAKIMFSEAPVPIYVLPSETGKHMITGKSIIEKYGYSDPLSVSFIEFLDQAKFPREGRHSWDPAAAVYAIEGCKDHLLESERGNIELTDTGVTYFTPDDNGNITVLKNLIKDGETEAESKARMAKYIDSCAELMIEESRSKL